MMDDGYGRERFDGCEGVWWKGNGFGVGYVGVGMVWALLVDDGYHIGDKRKVVVWKRRNGHNYEFGGYGGYRKRRVAMHAMRA